jgi:hypothetical protein
MIEGDHLIEKLRTLGGRRLELDQIVHREIL